MPTATSPTTTLQTTTLPTTTAMTSADLLPTAARDRRWCPECADERPFEMPPCEDGHGADCLDLACVDCGFAVVVGVLVDDEPVHVELVAA